MSDREPSRHGGPHFIRIMKASYHTRTLAIIHYSAPPDIGGIEQLIAAQYAVLAQLGHAVRVISGSEEAGGVIIPELRPDHPTVRRARLELDGGLPTDDHPLVVALVHQLRSALDGCQQCWVHNAFTMYLHPFLTMALLRLVVEEPGRSWVAWCEDLTSVSRYWTPLSPVDHARVRAIHPNLRYVTISHARRAELANFLQTPPEEIAVIPPPLDTLAWLDVGPETRELYVQLDFEHVDPLIFAPAKLLPHKNLALVVRVVAQLERRGARPMLLLTGATSPHDGDSSAAVRREILVLAQELGVAGRVHLLTDLLGSPPARRTVRDLMLLADLVVVPSTEEGFGTTLQEAAALRVPLLCSDIPALREVGGAAAHFFSLGDDPATVATQIQSLTNLPGAQQRRLVARSMAAFREALRALLETPM